MKEGTLVLLHEIIGFAVAGIMDRVSLLLQVIPDMETARGMPESFTADNKEDLHAGFHAYLLLLGGLPVPADHARGSGGTAVSYQ